MFFSIDILFDQRFPQSSPLYPTRYRRIFPHPPLLTTNYPHYMHKLLTTLILTILSLYLSATVRVTNLSIEGRQDSPLGIDVKTPSLGWRLMADDGLFRVCQTQYHILVASSELLLSQDKGDIWDHTTVSDQSQWIPFCGKKLSPNAKYWWKVRAEYSYSSSIDGKKTKKAWTEWSAPSSWSMGLMHEYRWKGYWIGMEHANPWDREDEHSRLSARYFRRTFPLASEVKRATLHICGLGLYEAYIDGSLISKGTKNDLSRLGDIVMTPAPTDYRKSIIYNTFDITPLLQNDRSKHCIAVTVSNGRFYTMQQNKKKHKITNFGYPCLRANIIIEYSDGKTETIATDDKLWRLNADGAIRSANEYDGEIYDARKQFGGSAEAWTSPDFDDSSWQLAQRSAIPSGTLIGNLTPPMRILDTLRVKHSSSIGNAIVMDFGQNYAGWTRINTAACRLSKGDTLRIRYAERLNADGSLYTANLRHAESTDYYIADGKTDSWWAPRFTTHGGRYIEVSVIGKSCPQLSADDVIGEVVSDDMTRKGQFSCGNMTLNRLMQNAYWGILSNYKGMPIDCPQRDERQPWLGDRTMGCWGESFLLDNDALYLKWIKDITEAQRSDGCIPDVAPAYWNYYSDNVTWPAVIITAAEMLYRQYGDTRAIEAYYPQMLKWFSHIWEDKRDSKTGLVKADKYGDWCVTPESPSLIHSQDPGRKTDGMLIGSAYMFHLAHIMKSFASILMEKTATDGMEMERRGMSRNVLAADTLLYNSVRSKLRKAINDHFLVVKPGTSAVTLYAPDCAPQHMLYPDSIYYANNSLTANLLPLAFGIVPEQYEEVITNQILSRLLLNPANGHLCCGVIGVQWLLTELSRRHRTDVAYLIASRKDFPSWGYMAEQGATTIWELWNGDTANPAMNSGNHVMLLGDLIPWMFRDLGGIAPAEAGYKRIRLAPRFELEELSQATASYECPYGMIKSSWQKTLDRLHWEISIPCNTVAEVQMPHKILTLGSGHYVFDESLPLSSVPADKQEGSDMQVKSNEFLYEKAEFPSCHACTIAELTNGDLLAAYFGGSYESCPDVCIYTQRKRLIKRDAKHGNVYETKWSAPVKVADGIMSDSLRKACYNPVLFQIPDGDLLLHYKIGKDVRDWTGYQMRSTDNGYTWSSQRDSIPAVAGVCPDSLLGAIKNQPIFLPKGFRCKNGTVLTTSRIIAPTSKETAFASKVKPGQWRCYMEISEDDGRSWTITPQVPQNDNLFRTIQPTVLIHRDGRLQLLARTAPPKHPAQKENARVATSWSDDGGLTWSEMEFVKDLPNNNSGIDAVTLPDGSFAIIYNPFGCVDWKKKTEADRNKPLRNPLWVATSLDGIHWTPQLSLESSPISQYSYPSMIVGSDGTLHCIYTWRRQRVKYQRIGFQ